MANIQNFPQKSKLRLNELLSFGRALEEKLSASAFASDETVKEQIAGFVTVVQALDDSLMGGGKWLSTPEMVAADGRRDTAQSGLLAQIRVYSNHYDSTKQEPGERLSVLAYKFAASTRLAFEEQTSLVENLIQEAESDTYKAAIEALPEVKGWLGELREANAQCKVAAQKQVEERMRRNATEKAPFTRKAFNERYEALVKRFNSLAEVFGDAKYVDLFAWWNALIDRFRIMISARLGAGAGGKTDGGASARPTTPSVTPDPEPDPEPEPDIPEIV